MSNTLSAHPDAHRRKLNLSDETERYYMQGFQSEVHDVNPFDYLDLHAYCAWEAGYADKHER